MLVSWLFLQTWIFHENICSHNKCRQDLKELTCVNILGFSLGVQYGGVDVRGTASAASPLCWVGGAGWWSLLYSLQGKCVEVDLSSVLASQQLERAWKLSPFKEPFLVLSYCCYLCVEKTFQTFPFITAFTGCQHNNVKRNGTFSFFLFAYCISWWC